MFYRLKSSSSRGLHSPLHQVGEPTRFGPRELLHIIRERWRLGAAIGFVTAISLFAVLMSQKPRYQAEALLLVELNTENIVNVQEVVETDVANNNMLMALMNTHVERLRSRSFAQLVVDTLTSEEREALLVSILGPREEWDPDATPPNLAAYLSNVATTFTWLPQALVIRINVQSGDPALAQALANRYANTYKRAQEELRSDAIAHAVAFLDEQSGDLKARIEADERALQGYRREHNLLSIEENQSIIAQKLSQLSRAITDARVRLLTVESRLEQVRSAEEDLSALVSISSIASGPSVRSNYDELERLRANQKILEEQYLEQHPNIIENQAAIRATETVLWNAVNHARDELAIEKRTIEEELSRLDGELVNATEEAAHLDRLAIDYRILSRKLEAARSTYDQLALRLNETGLSQEMTLSTIKVLDEASYPSQPAWPDPEMIGIAATLLFGMCFVGLPIGLELFDTRLRSFDDIESDLGHPVLGDVAYRKGRNERDLVAAVISKDDELSEPFHAIYSNLKLRFGKEQRPLTLIVTSSLPREGKTFIASNLAETFSAHKLKTILVDLDWRRPSIHQYHQIPNETGILQWLRSDSPLADNLIEDPNLGIAMLEGSRELYLLTSGGFAPQAAELLDDERLEQLVFRLKREFDVVIFDTPPVGLFPDAALLAEHADHTVFVARQNKVTRQRARSAIQTMAQSGAPVVGVVFNAIKNARLAAGTGNYVGTYQSSDYRRYRKSYRLDQFHVAQIKPALEPQLETS